MSDAPELPSAGASSPRARSTPGSRKLADKAGVVAFSRVLSALIDLVMMVVLVRLLSKDEIAVIGFLLLVYQTARSLATFGFPESVLYFFEQLARESRRGFALLTAKLLAVLGGAAGLVLVALAALAPYLFDNWGPENLALMTELLPLLALMAVIEIPTWPMHNVLLALDRQRSAAWYQILTSSAVLIAVVGPVLFGYSVAATVYGLVISAVCRFVVTAVWFQAVLPGPSKPLPPGTLRQQIGFSVPLGLNSLSTRINKYVDKFVVSLLLPAAAFADYQVGGQEIPFITAIPYAVGSVYISRYARLQLDGQRGPLIDLWMRGIEGVALIVVPVTALFLAIAHDFVTLIFGAQYASAVVPFQIYTIILFHRVTQYGAMLQAFADTRSILRLTLLILGCNAVLSAPMTLALGLPGTALATLISAAVGWIAYLRRIGQHLNLSIGQVFPWRIYGRILAVAGVAAIVAWLARFVGPLEDLNQVLALVLSGAIFGVIYGGLGTAVGAIERRDWVILWGWVRLRFLWRT